jgi:hypothetical protein
MIPGSQPLNELNSLQNLAYLPIIDVSSIIVWRPASYGDGVVSTQSQDMLMATDRASEWTYPIEERFIRDDDICFPDVQVHTCEPSNNDVQNAILHEILAEKHVVDLVIPPESASAPGSDWSGR